MIGSGIVKAVTGIVKAIAVDGTERMLQIGDRVLPNEQIITGDGGAIAVEFSDGTTLDLGRNSDAILNEATLFSNIGNKQASPTLEDVQEEVAAIQQALTEDQTFDPSKLEAPAAGGVAAAGGAGAEDDGSTMVEIDYLNPTMTPYNGFDTTGIGVVFPELIEELIQEPDVTVPGIDPLPPSIALSIEVENQYIKEDSIDNVINLNVSVDNFDTDVLQTITISQLPADAENLDLTGLTSAAGVSSSTGDGVNTPLVLTLDAGVTSFSGSFKLSPLEDSDVDITGILVTATAVNASTPTLQATASDTFDVVVDAILDEQAKIEQVEDAWDYTSRSGGETIDLNLKLSMVDASFPGSLDGGRDEDGSENVSSVTITIDEPGAKLIVDPSYTLTVDSTVGYTLTGYSDTADLEAAIKSLEIITPNEFGYSGTIHGIIKTITEDTNPNGGLEPDLADNSREGIFDFYARVGDEFDGFLGDAPNRVDEAQTSTDTTQATEIGFRITGPSLILDSANAEDQAFKVGFSQLLSNPTIQAQLSNIDRVNISGNIGLQENNQLSLSAQDVLDFNQQDSLQQLNIVGDTGDQVNLIDQDGAGAGSWSLASHNDFTETNTYSYLNNGQIIADITIDNALTVVM